MKGYAVRKHQNHRIYLGSIGDGYHVVVHDPTGCEVGEATVYDDFKAAIEEGKAIVDKRLEPNDDQEDLFDDAFEAMCQATHKEGWS
jgi:hypothetical protein